VREQRVVLKHHADVALVRLAVNEVVAVELDRAAVDFDRVQLSYTRITAPITGRVGLRLVDPGNVVVANTTTVLVVIAQMQPISVVFPLSEDHLSEVRAQANHGAGLRVDVFDRLKTKLLATGQLSTIDNQIDTATGTVRLRAGFANAREELFPNQFVNARLLVSTVRDATVLPSSAVQRNGPQTFVYAIRDGHVQVTPVTVGVVSGERTQVDGVSPGTVVASSSFEKLRDGAPVVATAPPAPSEPPPRVQAQR
jgi:multidrug efflux system membrane fusion protein